MRQIPSSLNEKLNTSQQTPANKADPKMSIKVSRAKTTIMDSDYWTVETIRSKPGLGDVSVAPRRFKPYGPPDRIYEIHVENGIVGTSIREYPDTFKEGWKEQFTLGEGSAVAITFDGEWQRYRDRWRLVTTEKPWIAWVDSTGQLWTQYWDDELTRILLDSDVVSVRMIRAWKNLNIVDKDQGIIAAYLKSDGKLYYRSYCETLEHTRSWEAQRQVTQFEGTAISLNLFITNDYRVGFIIENIDNQIHWFITDRNWAGMAMLPEYLTAKTMTFINLVKIDKLRLDNQVEHLSSGATITTSLLYASADNEFISAENFSIETINDEGEPYQEWGVKVRTELKYDLTEVDFLDFRLRDSLDTIFGVTGFSRVGPKTYEFTVVDFNNAHEALILSFSGSGNTRGEAGQSLDPFSIEFSPMNLVPKKIPLPEVFDVWNE